MKYSWFLINLSSNAVSQLFENEVLHDSSSRSIYLYIYNYKTFDKPIEKVSIEIHTVCYIVDLTVNNSDLVIKKKSFFHKFYQQNFCHFRLNPKKIRNKLTFKYEMAHFYAIIYHSFWLNFFPWKETWS